MDENLLNDLLECSVCLDRLDTSSKVLPCQHTFCRKCLEVIAKSRKELRCPECRVLVNVPIDDLPSNILLMRILEGMKNASTIKNQENSRTKEDEESCQQKERLDQPDDVNVRKANAQLIEGKPDKIVSNETSRHESIDSGRSIQYQRRCILPHGYALYDYNPKDTNDFHFKKGDLVLLKRKIDPSWYLGQSNGVEGCFPINYVNVIVPLPLAQCIALYDFKMGPNEEEGCLSFTKGTIIQVIRRIDINWAEGYIGSTVGIFPIAFVELNNLAKQILDSSKTVPPVSLKNDGTPKNSVEHPQSLQHSMQFLHMPPLPNSNKTAFVNARKQNVIPLMQSTTLATQHQHSVEFTNSSEMNTRAQMNNNFKPSTAQAQLRSKQNAIFNMPNCISGNNSVRLRDGERHVQSNRHSANIQNLYDDPKPMSATNLITTDHSGTEENKDNAINRLSVDRNVNEAAHNSQIDKTNANHGNALSLPWGYLALYPYKPHKTDELELIKGAIYIVTERCQDGWLKGKNCKGISGVFPGNYVMPLTSKHQNQLFEQWKHILDSNVPYTTPKPGLSVHTNEMPWCPQSLQATNMQTDNKTIGQNMIKLNDCSTGESLSMAQRTSNVNAQDNLSSASTDLRLRKEPLNPLSAIHVRSGSCPSQFVQNKSVENRNLDQYSRHELVEKNHLNVNQLHKNDLPKDAALSVRRTMDDSTLRNVCHKIASEHLSAQRNASLIDSKKQKNDSNPNTVQVFHRKSHSLDASKFINVADTYSISEAAIKASATTKPQQAHESRFRCIAPYPPNSDVELELDVGDIIYVHRKQKNGWYKGTHARTYKTGLFPASFVAPDD